MLQKIKVNYIKELITEASFSRKLFLSFIFGAINALAMPPIGLFLILPISFSIFILLTTSATNKRESFLIGWLYGAGYFIFSLYWVTYALFVDIANWWWLVPISLVIAPTILALYYGFIPLIAYRYKKNNDLHIIAICFAFALVEYLRGTLFTGFPWNLAGYSWHHFLPIMQINAYIGIYGLTLLTFIWSSYFVLNNDFLKKIIIISFAISAILGTYRLSSTSISHYKNTAIRIVQPNIKQKNKWDPKYRYKNLEKLLDITRSPINNNLPIKFVIWPETSTLYKLNESNKMLNITSASLPNNAIGIFGSMNSKTLNAKQEIFNSVSFVSKKDKMITSYNKHHLVPFGEYIPFRKILGLTPFANAIAKLGDFSRGKGITTIDLGKNHPSPSPLICYEAIFPSQVTNRSNRPNWLINVTNDAWYGNSAGPYQHFEIVRVRAIEEGLPLVRAANTGISAIINPLGIIQSKLPLEEQGKIDALLAKPIAPTLFSIFGNYIFLLSLLSIFIVCEASYRKIK